MEESDLEAREDLGLAPVWRVVVVVVFEASLADGLADPALVGLVVLLTEEVVADVLGFPADREDGAVALPLQATFSTDVSGPLSMEAAFSPDGLSSAVFPTSAPCVPASQVTVVGPSSLVDNVPSPSSGVVLGPSVALTATDLDTEGFTPPCLLPVAAFELVFSGPISFPFDTGFSFPICCSCLFFSKALFFSAIASAFSFSLARFSSSFFFRSASIVLEDLGAVFVSPGQLGFLASLDVAALLGLVAVGLPAEAGFFCSG